MNDVNLQEELRFWAQRSIEKGDPLRFLPHMRRVLIERKETLPKEDNCCPRTCPECGNKTETFHLETGLFFRYVDNYWAICLSCSWGHYDVFETSDLLC